MAILGQLMRRVSHTSKGDWCGAPGLAHTPRLSVPSFSPVNLYPRSIVLEPEEITWIRCFKAKQENGS